MTERVTASDLATRFLGHARASQLFPEPGLALLAVSGGPDSVAMLGLCATAATDLELELAVAHLDHGILAGSGAVARDVSALAQRYGLTCHEARLGLGAQTSETRARRERYKALRDIQRATGARYLVTAHHADDLVETVLYRLLRGTGVAGLIGIPPRGPDGLVRPLLPFTRAELEAWRLEHMDPDIPVHEDPANVDRRHDRSWIRHDLLPQLRERFGPVIDDRLLDVGKHAAREQRAWAMLLRQLTELDFRAYGDAVAVARGPLRRYDKTLSEALLRALGREVGCVLGPRRAARLLAFVRASTSGHVMQLGGGWEAESLFDRVQIVRAANRMGTAGRVTVPLRESETGGLDWGGWHITWRYEPAGEPTRAAFSTWVTPGANQLRGPKAGDRMIPLGGVGHRRVRRLMMEAKVPFRDRDAYPVLVRDRQVLWVPGICRSDAAIPGPGEPAVRIDAHTSGHN